MIKILVADDHAVVRKGVKEILEDTEDMIVAGEAANGHEVLNEVSRNHYDVLLLDMAMPVRSGADILKELRNLKPNLPVLILSMYPEDQYAVRLLRVGASGYLTKESAPEELVAAIRKVSTGGKYVSATLAEKLASHLQKDGERPVHQTLSDREYQVMCMIASGKTVGEIASELLLSIKTVSTYRSRILEKMNMKNNVDLTRYAVQNQLVS